MTDRGGKSDLISMSVYVVYSSERAVLVQPVYARREPAWVPLSQVELTPTEYPGIHTLHIPEWLAVEKGLL